MAAPWEQYQQAPQDGPWSQYQGQAPQPEQAPSYGLKEAARDFMTIPRGIYRGVQDVTDTLVKGGASLADMVTGGDARQSVDQSIAANEQGFQDQYGGSGIASVARFGGNVAATIPAGGVLAKGLSMVPGAATKAAPLIEALRTSGMRTGQAAVPALSKAGAQQMGIRATGGAATGGASAGLVNPNDAGMGATVGGAFPLLGTATMAAYRGGRNVMRPTEAKLAEKLAAQSNLPVQDVIRLMEQQGPSMLPGYQKTVPQILQDPTFSQLQRNLKTAGTNAIGDVESMNQQALTSALNRVAPIQSSTFDAANRAGSAIQNFARNAEGDASQAVRQAFEEVDPTNQTALLLPLDEMQQAKSQFLGRGTFGTGSRASDAISTAKAIGTEQSPDFANAFGDDAVTLLKTVPFREVQNLRSSIGEAAEKAAEQGANKESAALRSMISSIDDTINRAASGNARVGESFPTDIADQYRKALALHEDKMTRFYTGPQAGIFRKGGDGQMSIQGAEIAPKFYNSAMSQADDVKAFKRLIGDRTDLADELKSFAVTQADATRDSQGNLGEKYIKWMQSRAGANKELMSPQDLATIREVGKAVQNQIRTEGLGRVTGSDTAQKLATMQSNGILDNRFVDVIANRIPVVSSFTGPMLQGLRNTATETRNQQLAKLLADPQAFANALKKPNENKAVIDALRLLGNVSVKSAPALVAD